MSVNQESSSFRKGSVNVNVVRDGVNAMAYLCQQGKFQTVRLPDLILLDLNMPRKDGREVLAEMQANDQLSHIPVVILTTSEADEDVLKTYQIGANAYVAKPVGLSGLIKVVNLLEEFWLTIVKLPPTTIA